MSRGRIDFSAIDRMSKERDALSKDLAKVQRELDDALMSEKALRAELQLATGELCIAFCMRSAPDSKKHTTGCRRRVNVLAGVLL